MIRKKRFWISIFIIILISIIFDLIVLNWWAVHSLTSGKWDMRLVLGTLLLLSSDFFSRISKKWKTQTAASSRFVFFLLVISAIIIHGFLSGLVFMSMIFILSRFIMLLVWIAKKVIEKYKKRGLLEEI